MNALTHGARAESRIIPGEDSEALAELTEAYRNEYHPEGPEEELLLDTIVRADWTQRRMARLEAEVFTALLSDSESEPVTAGAAFLKDAAGPNALQKIYRRDQAAAREWRRARTELRRLQEERLLRAFRRDRPERTQFPAASATSQSISPTQPATPIPVSPSSAERTQSSTSPASSHSASPAASEVPGPRPPTPAPELAPAPVSHRPPLQAL